jgi:aldose 1-epimerase
MLKGTQFKIYTLVLLAALACKPKQEKTETAEQTTQPADTIPAQSIAESPFGKTADGKDVKLFTLKNKNGVEVGVINRGGIIVSLKTPDKNGNIQDIVLGYDSLGGYAANNNYFGALIGRYGNRIGSGKFTLDGVEYKLAQNDGKNHLHGGANGFDKVFWNIEEGPSKGNSLKLTYTSKDGEEGYPGNLNTEVVYTLTDDNELKIDYKATTDKKTVVNLTQHTYFNLSGDASKDILGHKLSIDSDSLLPVDKGLIPTGKMTAVKGTPFDFKTATVIGARINAKDQQLQLGEGYDHCWVLNNKGSLRSVAVLSDSVSGRVMEVLTTEPGIQFYSGNFLNGKSTGKGGVAYARRSALCLETQHYPDSPNKPSFPTTVLSPGETYTTTTIYKFSSK